MNEITYLCISIVEMHSDNTVTIESISVNNEECILSGAWEFAKENLNMVKSVIGDSLIVVLGNKNEFINYINDSKIRIIESKTFLKEAKESAANAIKLFEKNQAEQSKNTVSPKFYDWPDKVDFNDSIAYLDSIGKMSYVENTPEKMQKTLATAKLIKHFIDMWRADEIERKNRKYIEIEDREITLLPNNWLQFVK